MILRQMEYIEEQQQKKSEEEYDAGSDSHYCSDYEEEEEDESSTSETQPKNFRTCLVCHKSGHIGPKCFKLTRIKKPEERRKYLSDNQVSISPTFEEQIFHAKVCT
jgi:hypothetical protein